jgi:hypothetical protein
MKKICDGFQSSAYSNDLNKEISKALQKSNPTISSEFSFDQTSR